ncbi:MAG TPA: class I SAM-dependent methyltransferase [Chloroflexia bacterium]|nr:class I SAM-dependent methyltransferase [Chloroflexia bacterium]
MESIRGKHAMCVDAATLTRHLAGYPHILVDLGTGDGRYVRHVATRSPGTFAIGIDLCVANMREASRRAPANTLFLIARAHALPAELQGLATHLTINFPWGDLLTGLLGPDTRLPDGLAALLRPGGLLEIRLNGGAVAEVGSTLGRAGAAVGHGLWNAGFRVEPPRLLDARELRACPTTWAHRLAFGRDPCALYIRAMRRTDR